MPRLLTVFVVSLVFLFFSSHVLRRFCVSKQLAYTEFSCFLHFDSVGCNGGYCDANALATQVQSCPALTISSSVHSVCFIAFVFLIVHPITFPAQTIRLGLLKHACVRVVNLATTVNSALLVTFKITPLARHVRLARFSLTKLLQPSPIQILLPRIQLSNVCNLTSLFRLFS